MTDLQRMCRLTRGAIPVDPPKVDAWAQANVQFPNSVRSKHFDLSITPWLREPLMKIVHDDFVKIVTLIKPVQTGGSTIGEVAMLYWIMFSSGMLQYNWSNDKRAMERWNSRVERILKACPPVSKKLAQLPRYDESACEVDFGNIFFRMQGTFVPINLDSDSIHLQVNEELHDWKPGHLAKARNRQTAVWNPKALDISNASMHGDQLHQAFEAGTCREWEVQCPGCGKWHVMRTRWEDAHPEAGGLRYDGKACALGGGKFDYAKMAGTVRYQMPCGFLVRDDVTERRALSDGGKYSDPRNQGANGSHESYTYDAVAVDFIPWISLIMAKHEALRARDSGDIAPFMRYVTEKECKFFHPKHSMPGVVEVILQKDARKSREGLKGRAARFGMLDRQKGRKDLGESPHWWLVLRDAMKNGDSQLVFEGKLYTEMDVVSVLDEYSVARNSVAADATWDTQNVMNFCFSHGIHAFMSTDERDFSHGKEGRKIFSQDEAIYDYLNRPPKYPKVPAWNGSEFEQHDDPREPMWWRVSKFGMKERLAWVRDADRRRKVAMADKEAGKPHAEADLMLLEWNVPGDVSEDYKTQIDSWSYMKLSKDKAATQEERWGWVKVGDHDHMLYCEEGIAILMEMAQLIGAGVAHEEQPK